MWHHMILCSDVLGSVQLMFRKSGYKFHTSYSSMSINVFFSFFFDKNRRFKIFAAAFKLITFFIRASIRGRTLNKNPTF